MNALRRPACCGSAGGPGSRVPILVFVLSILQSIVADLPPRA
ncbi:hypothetical protein QJS66_05465 [Kocuria rhizophila]|nr:hypothetical protein QJS66_05465 [Kocuria rhizophila]